MDRFTSKEDLADRIYGLEQYKPGAKSARDLAIGISSGTTSSTPTFVVVNREHGPAKTTYLGNAPIYKTGARVMRFTANLQNTYRLVTSIFERANPANYLPLVKSDIDNTHFPDLILSFRPTQLSAPPSLLVYALQTLENTGAKEALSYLKTHIDNAVDFSGELFTDTQKHVIKTFLPNATLYNDYSLSEVPWFTCTSCRVRPDENLSVLCVGQYFTEAVDIRNPDEKGIGEIAIQTQELGWYRTGDTGKTEAQRCACGSTKKLTVLGRTNYDIVQCVGATFRVDEIDRVFRLLHDYVLDYLVEVSEKVTDGTKVRGHVHLTIVPITTLNEHPTAGSIITQAFEKQLFVTPSKVLEQLIEEGIFLPTEITFTSEIPRGNKKIRLRRIA